MYLYLCVTVSVLSCIFVSDSGHDWRKTADDNFSVPPCCVAASGAAVPLLKMIWRPSVAGGKGEGELRCLRERCRVGGGAYSDEGLM